MVELEKDNTSTSPEVVGASKPVGKLDDDVSPREPYAHLLGFAKEHFWIVAAIGGILFAAGWIAQFTATARLGVGALQIAREPTLIAGVLALTTALPICYFAWLMADDSHSERAAAFGFIFMLVLCGFLFYLFINLCINPPFTGHALERAGALFLPTFIIALLSITQRLLKSTRRKSLFLPLIAYGGLFHVWFFGSLTLPFLRPELGGFLLQPVILKAEGYTASPYVLITSDSARVIVATGSPEEFYKRISRGSKSSDVVSLNWSKIEWIKSDASSAANP